MSPTLTRRERSRWLQFALAATPQLIVTFGAIVLGTASGIGLHAAQWVMVLLCLIVLVVGYARLRSKRFATGAYIEADAAARRGDLRAAAIGLEEALRSMPQGASTRAAALAAFALVVSRTGSHRRVLPLAEAVAARGWRGGGAHAANLVRAIALVRSEHFELARTLCDEIRRNTSGSAPLALTEALLAARAGDDAAATKHLGTALRWAWWSRDRGIDRTAALLLAFVLDRSRAPVADVTLALERGREASADAIAGLVFGWPELRDFVSRRLDLRPRTGRGP